MVLDWLLSPIDPARIHDVPYAVAWHGRAMVAAWVVLCPIGVLAARFVKITPGQDWPRRTDNKLWWWTHLACQYSGGLVFLAGLWMVLALHTSSASANVHYILGWTVVALGALQFASGWTRGSKGGPTVLAPDGSLRGDHYDMTRRRLIFEMAHKTCGYLVILVAAGAVLTGLWQVNAPRWMWVIIALWWGFLTFMFVALQRRGFAIDTYQAIWGPALEHPGNRRPHVGWGMRRLQQPDRQKERNQP